MIKLHVRDNARRHLDRGLPFRNLYTRVLLSLQAKVPVVVGVTSAIAGEGKTTIAAGLATTLAEEGPLLKGGRQPGDVLLMHCNQGPLPGNRELLSPGLIQYLRGQCTLDQAIKPGGHDRLAVLPLGEPAGSFPVLIRNAALGDTLQQLRQRFDLIVIDMPPLLTSTDTQVLTGMADSLLLVVRSGVTPNKLVSQAIEELDESKLLGVVLNDYRPALPAWLDQRL